MWLLYYLFLIFNYPAFDFVVFTINFILSFSLNSVHFCSFHSSCTWLDMLFFLLSLKWNKWFEIFLLLLSMLINARNFPLIIVLLCSLFIYNDFKTNFLFDFLFAVGYSEVVFIFKVFGDYLDIFLLSVSSFLQLQSVFYLWFHFF